MRFGERQFDSFVQFLLRRPLVPVGIVVLLTAISAFWLIAFKPLRLDTNFTTLLPDELPCVVESRRVSRLVGSTDFLYIAITSPVPADNMAFAQDMAKRLASLPFIDWVTTREDKSFFRRHRLLYLETADLQTIVRRAKARVAYEKKVANPFFVSLDDEPPPDIGFDDIMEKYDERLARAGVKGILGTSKKAGQDAGNGDTSKKVDTGDFIASPDGTLVTVMARPSRPAVDMDFARMLVERAQKLIDASNPHRNDRMRVKVAGSYRNRTMEYNNIVNDIVTSIASSLVLIVLIIIVYFRRARSLVLVLLPLVAGTVLSVAVTALTLGRLNMVTALIFAVVMGLGIDFGVHMTTRYLDERGRGKTLQESMMLALSKTGRAILTAGLTTAGALGVMAAAEFKGFMEFGIIAMLGILICLVVYIVMVPALGAMMERFSAPSPWRRKSMVGDRPVRRIPAWLPGVALVVIAAVTAVAFVQARRIEFEYDFRRLGSQKKVSTTIQYGRTLSQSSSPVVILLNTPQQAKAATRHLEKVMESPANVDGLLRNVFSLFTFIPDDQERKIALLGELQGYVDEALALRKLKKDVREQLEELREWTDVAPITEKSLPDWVTAKFTRKDGQVGGMVYLFPRVNEFHVDQMARFYDLFGVIDIPDVGRVHPTASGFILVEVIRAVQRDGVTMTAISLAVVLLVLVLDFRRPGPVLLTFGPLLVSLIWVAGIMGMTGMKLGLYNMLVLPLLLGVGIDTAVHIYHSYQEQGPGSLRSVIRTTGMATLIASVTTGVGFVGMMTVSHNGLRTIGSLAIVGISVTLIGSMITLVAFLAWRESRKK